MHSRNASPPSPSSVNKLGTDDEYDDDDRCCSGCGHAGCSAGEDAACRDGDDEVGLEKSLREAPMSCRLGRW